MTKYYYSLLIVFGLAVQINAQAIFDDFEGNGNITSWFGDAAQINTSFPNPFPTAANPSATVMRYADTGGLFANVRFQHFTSFNMSQYYVFSLKIYVPSSGITGNQPNQVSLKLQNGTISAPWTTQTEIIHPIVLDQWQTLVFDFSQPGFINTNQGSPAPTLRNDFSRVLIQVNGENNNDHVLAFIDDFYYETTEAEAPPIPNFDYLVWSDEFEVDGAVDSDKWFHQTLLPNGSSWFNGEIQHYTNRIENSFVSNGTLKIMARRESFTDQGVTTQFTSARLNSKFKFQKGRVVVRAKLPTGVGTWPAIWTLGVNITEPGGFWTDEFGTTPWPACGEIDIMEHWGSNQNFVQSAMHTPSSFGNTVNHGGQFIPTVSTQFHDYELVWTDDQMIFSVDGVVHYIYNPPVKNLQTWPFTWDHYLLLNVAIQPNIAASFMEGAMEIDFVRVYQEAPLSTPEFQKSNELKIFPNPTKSELNIRTSENSFGKTVEMYSVLGQKMTTVTLNDFDTKVNVQSLPKGIYLLRFEQQVLKFVKD